MEREPVDADVLRAALGPRWARVDVVAETGSTNADLLAQPDGRDRNVLVAEHQSAGRGRLDRAWTSPRGAGLTFSVSLRPSAPIATWGWLPLLTGVALHEAVREYAGVEAALKWPNDLLAGPDGRKVAGILAQTSGPAVVVGVGLNVSTTADELPPPAPSAAGPSAGATSLALSGAPGVDRGGLLVAILVVLDARLVRWEADGGDAEACGLAAAYRAACATIGQEVRVTGAGGRVIVGTAVAIDSDGRLLLATDSGTEVVGAGDVQHLRPAR